MKTIYKTIRGTSAFVVPTPDTTEVQTAYNFGVIDERERICEMLLTMEITFDHTDGLISGIGRQDLLVEIIKGNADK